MPNSYPAGVITQRFGDLAIHALHTGWVRVKAAHRDLRGPVATRVLSILLDRRWTDWMPVTCYAIEHPEGVFVVDTGLTERIAAPDRFAGDPGNAFVYQRLLQFRFEPEDRIDRRLETASLALDRLGGIVLTHRHADHVDGLRLLPATAPVYVGAADWPSHRGVVASQWPAGRTPILVDELGERFGAMLGSRSLTSDGRVRIVPLPGHSPGHLGVLVQLDERYALFAGDATFDHHQVCTGRIAGIVEEPARARATLGLLAAQLAVAPTFLLPAHDREALDRFARGEVSAAAA